MGSATTASAGMTRRTVRLRQYIPIALVLLAGCGKNVSGPCGPVLPSLGDEALVNVKEMKPERKHKELDKSYIWRRSDYNHYSVLIRCVRVANKRFLCEVYHRQKNAWIGPVYLVAVDYARTDLGERTVVRNVRGVAVPRGTKGDGFPIPFHDFLSFDLDYLGYSRKRPANLAGSRYVHLLRSGREGHNEWSVGLFVAPRRYSRPTYYERQGWKRGRWIWYRNEHRGEDGLWEATVATLGNKSSVLCSREAIRSE